MSSNVMITTLPFKLGRCVKLPMKTVLVDPTGVFHWVDQRTIKGGGGGGVFANIMVGTKGHTHSKT